MSEWPVTPIKVAARITLGKMAQPQPRSDTDIEAPYLRAAHVQPQGRLIDPGEQTMWFSPSELRELDLRSGDVVIVEGGAGFGRAAYLSDDLLGWGFQNSIVRLRPRHGTGDGRFLAYLFQHLLDSGETALAASVATIPHFTAEKVAAIRRPIPPLPVQRQIGDFLDRETAQVDAMIEAQRELVAALEERRKAVLDDLVDSHGSWHVPLKRRSTVTVGIVVTPAEWYSDEGDPALRGTNVREESFDLTDLVRLSDEGHRIHPKSRLSSGDVVVVRTGQAGKAACVPRDMEGWNAIDLLLVKPGALLLGEYLAMILNSTKYREQVAVGSVGAIQGHFNVESLANLDIPDVPVDAQRDAVACWRSASALIHRL